MADERKDIYDDDEFVGQIMQAGEELMQMVDDLKKENDFLTDTIIADKKGKISEERRKLLDENRTVKKDAEKLLNNAYQIKDEYDAKLEKISVLLQSVKAKETDLDAYIIKISEKKISKRKKMLDAKLKEEQKKLQAEFQEKETQLDKKMKTYKILLFISSGIAVASIIITVFQFL